jgi:hypothetical protein
MMAILKSDTVVRQWGTMVDRGAGRDKWVLDRTEALIKQSSPATVTIRREPVTVGMFSEKREFLIVAHQTLREYAIFIHARNFGQDLSAGWYLTVNPGFLKRAVSKKIANGDPNALSGYISVFAQQDLSAMTNIAHNRLRQVIAELMEELKQDNSQVDWNPKGFLSMW